MNGLSMTAWRDPWHVRALRSMRRHPWPVVQQVGAWIVVAMCIGFSVFGIPLALLVMGGGA